MATKLDKDVLEILTGAHALLEKRGIWCKGWLVEYKDADGELCKVDGIEQFPKTLPIPHRVCALGAAMMQPAAVKRRSGGLMLTAAYYRAEKLLGECVPSAYDGSIIDYNDRVQTTKRQVLKVYDAAIAKARG